MDSMLMHCAVLLSQYVVSRVTVLTMILLLIIIDTDINTDTVDTDTETACKFYFLNHISHISI